MRLVSAGRRLEAPARSSREALRSGAGRRASVRRSQHVGATSTFSGRQLGDEARLEARPAPDQRAPELLRAAGAVGAEPRRALAAVRRSGGAARPHRVPAKRQDDIGSPRPGQPHGVGRQEPQLDARRPPRHQRARPRLRDEPAREALERARLRVTDIEEPGAAVRDDGHAARPVSRRKAGLPHDLLELYPASDRQ